MSRWSNETRFWCTGYGRKKPTPNDFCSWDVLLHYIEGWRFKGFVSDVKAFRTRLTKGERVEFKDEHVHMFFGYSEKPL